MNQYKRIIYKKNQVNDKICDLSETEITNTNSSKH